MRRIYINLSCFNPGGGGGSGGPFLPLTGGTLTGPLVLPGPPTTNLQATDKLYVDTGDTTNAAAAAAANTNANTRVLKAGDTMTGFLTLNADPTTALKAATKQYVDAGDAAVQAAAATDATSKANTAQSNAQAYTDAQAVEAPFPQTIGGDGTTVTNGWVQVFLPGAGIIRIMTTA